MPAPSGVDVANTIKYFSQTFLSESPHNFSAYLIPTHLQTDRPPTFAGVLKDVPSSPHQMIKDPSQDHIRMSAYPNLEYGNLYNALAMLIDVAQNIQFGLNGECRTPQGMEAKQILIGFSNLPFRILLRWKSLR